MGDDTGIQWTDATWNPTRGCRRVSPGCENCYAERQAGRFSGEGMPYHGLVRLGDRGARWTGEGRLVPSLLDQPLRWRRPRRIFVNSMSDLFYEGFANEEIAAVFGVMAAAPQHTFQVLTKRAKSMRQWFEWVAGQRGFVGEPRAFCKATVEQMVPRSWSVPRVAWPLPNVWLGVSVEDQQRADERIPDLLATPAAVRFVSYEPALGPVDFENVRVSASCTEDVLGDVEWRSVRDAPPGIDWIIVGGESGPGARVFDLEWARSVVLQCRRAGVACFVKQMGARPFDGGQDGRTFDSPKHPKGADPAEWPAGLRVREWPVAHAR